jgi:hypothetical protein
LSIIFVTMKELLKLLTTQNLRKNAFYPTSTLCTLFNRLAKIYCLCKGHQVAASNLTPRVSRTLLVSSATGPFCVHPTLPPLTSTSFDDCPIYLQ